MSLEIALSNLEFSYTPGATVAGVVTWDLDRPPSSAELRLFWYTEGKGTQDLVVVVAQSFTDPQSNDRRDFQLAVPLEGPLSFSGTFISLIWALELVLEPGPQAQRIELLVSTTGREIRLKRLPEEKTEPHAPA